MAMCKSQYCAGVPAARQRDAYMCWATLPHLDRRRYCLLPERCALIIRLYFIEPGVSFGQSNN